MEGQADRPPALLDGAGEVLRLARRLEATDAPEAAVGEALVALRRLAGPSCGDLAVVIEDDDGAVVVAVVDREGQAALAPEVVAEVQALVDAALKRIARQQEEHRKGEIVDAALSVLSHDLGNVMTQMVAAADLVEESGDQLDERGRELAATVLSRASRRAVDVLNGVSALRRLDLDRGVARPAAVLRDLISQCGWGEAVIGDGDEDLTVGVPAPALARMLDNLVSNGLRHAPPGTCVDVSWVAAGDVAQIAVEDRGPGVPPALRPVVCEPYRQGRAHGAIAGSVGLGLFVVRSMVDLAGGSLTIDDRPGGGASFRVELPLAT